MKKKPLPKMIARTDFLPGAVIVNKYSPEREFTAGVEVWSDRGKLFIRIPVEGDHPLQVEVNSLERTYDVCIHD